jgi:biopolymer transport protein ExbD
MAFSSLNGGGTISSRRRFRHISSISEMNVVPLVDVVLVLLIVFMLTAHVMEFGLEVEVPQVRQVRETAEELPVVSITRDGLIYMGETSVNLNALPEAFRKQYAGEKTVYVRADKGVVWDVVAQVFSVLGDAQIGVRAVTRPMDDTPTRRR